MKYLGFERSMWADSYNFFLKYLNIDANDTKMWEELYKDYGDICKKYANHPMIRKLLISVVDDLECRCGTTLIEGKTYKEWEDNIQKSQEIGGESGK